MRTHLARENRKWGRRFLDVPREDWPPAFSALPTVPVRVWRNRDYLVQMFDDEGGANRLSICRTQRTANGQSWEDGMTWDDLMAVKSGVGLGDRWAVEVFPPDADVVNLANMRHLWVLPEPPSFGWRAERVG